MLSKQLAAFCFLALVVAAQPEERGGYKGKKPGKGGQGNGKEKNDYAEEDTLMLTNIVFRHGDRTPDPLGVYPTDPYINETYSPYGFGQLTLQGKQNAYRLGESFRERYKNFLGSSFSPSHVDSFTSSYPRTQMTLQAVHAALFPPSKDDALKRGLDWQPLSYTYYGPSEDNLIATHRSCDMAFWITDDIEKSGAYDFVLDEFKPLYEYLSNHTGWAVNNTKFSFFTYNTLQTEEEWGFALPEWATAIYPEPLKSAASWFWILYSSTPQLRRITVGSLIKKIILDSEAKASNTLIPADRKMFLYSGHDFTVVPLMSAIGHYTGEQLPYTAHVIIELHKIDGVYGYKVFVQDYKEAKPRLVKVHGCEEFCPLSQFRAMFEDHFPGPEWCAV